MLAHKTRAPSHGAVVEQSGVASPLVVYERVEESSVAGSPPFDEAE
jgi:hypothetical protein